MIQRPHHIMFFCIRVGKTEFSNTFSATEDRSNNLEAIEYNLPVCSCISILFFIEQELI